VILSLAKQLVSRTRPRDLIVLTDLNWDPAVLYYSRRRGLMLVSGNIRAVLADDPTRQPYRFLFTADQQRYSPNTRAALQTWQWFGFTGPHLFRLGHVYSDVSSAPVAESPAVMALPAATTPLISAPARIPCSTAGATLVVPAGSAAFLEMSGALTGASVRVQGMWVPAEPTMIVSPVARAPNGEITLACAGPASLTIQLAVATTSS
jgi:hypothetical protein